MIRHGCPASLEAMRDPRLLGGRGDRGAWLWAARIACAAVAFVAVLSYEVVLSPPAAVGLIGVDGLAAVGLGVSIFRPQRWLGWVLIGAAVAVLGVGAVLFALTSDRLVPEAYPRLWDVSILVAYLPLAVGLLLLGRPRLPSQEWPVLLDTAALSLAVSLVVWIVLVQPALAVMPTSGVGRLIIIASLVGYATLLATAARVLLVWRTNVSLALVATAVGWLLAAEFFSAELLLRGSSSTGRAADLGFTGLSLLCGAAALTASMSRMASPGLGRNQVGPLRLGMVAVGLLVAPTALLVQATSGVVTTGVAIGVVSAAVGALVPVRVLLAAQDARRRAEREQAMQVASREFMLATRREQVVSGAARAITSMISPGEVMVASRTDHQARRASADSEHTADTDSDVDEIVLDLTSGPQQPQRPAAGSPDTAHDQGGLVLIVHAPAEDLAELDPVLRALADQAASAVRRTELLAELQAEERERYFRTLVLTSDDVTLISRGGVVAYATPSALGMFGQDITGHPIDELLDGGPAPSGWWTATNGAEATVPRADGEVIVWVRSRDLHGDPTVNGVVTTLRDITAERHLRADLAFRASHDPLTGLANARLFNDELHASDDAAEQLAERRRPSRSGRAALFIDLDDFKTVNDTYGHEVGDRLLAEVACRIQDCLRADDLAARLGGDEFAVLLRNVTGVDAVRDVAERIAAKLAAPASVDDVTLNCQATIGLAYHSGSGRTDTLLREADSALYSAKAAGKGQWREYHHGMPIPSRQRVEDRHRLEDALANGHLDVHYQPIVDLATADAVGFEAVVRHDNDHPMGPREVIAAAEDTDLIVVLGSWVLEQAIAALPVLNPSGTASPRYVSVNVYARQLRQADFIATMRDRIVEAGVDPRLIVLEMTDALFAAADDRNPAWNDLAELRRAGVRIAFDNYGTGYACLGRLRQPVFDLVKTDKSFLTEPDHRARDLILLQVVSGLCRRLNLDLIVDGVEDTDGLHLAKAAGARYGQGFLYAPALPLTEAANYSTHDVDRGSDGSAAT
jgi:diguanylate cyclase (GGDEF)-like protein